MTRLLFGRRAFIGTGLGLGLLSAPAFAFLQVSPESPGEEPPPPPMDTLDTAMDTSMRMTVGVLVNGRGPFDFTVDSGADRSVIARELARRLGLPPGPSVLLQGMAGADHVSTVMIDRLKVGSREIRDVAAPALHDGYLGGDGLLGIDALAGQRVTMDFVARRMTISASTAPPPPSPRDRDEIVVTARRKSGQLIFTEASVGGRSIRAVIDSGSQVTVGNSALRTRIYASRRPPTIVPITLISVTGRALVAEETILPDVQIGGIRMENVPVAFADVPPFKLFGVAKVPALLIGTDLLRIFERVSLDFGRKKVRFLMREASANPVNLAPG